MFVRFLTLSLMILVPASAWADTIVSAPYAAAAAARGEVTIIDARSRRGGCQTSIPKGAWTVTIHNPNRSKVFIKATDKAVGGDRSKPVVLISAAGVGSTRAVRILCDAGFMNLQNIYAGMRGHTQSGLNWLNRGLSTNPRTEC